MDWGLCEERISCYGLNRFFCLRYDWCCRRLATWNTHSFCTCTRIVRSNCRGSSGVYLKKSSWWCNIRNRKDRSWESFSNIFLINWLRVELGRCLKEGYICLHKIFVSGWIIVFVPFLMVTVPHEDVLNEFVGSLSFSGVWLCTKQVQPKTWVEKG